MSEAKKIKPSLSKGTRDFLPAEVAKRNYIFDTIKGVFRKYGFEQIETPAIERLDTLTGKYGEEGDKLLFKILNSGDYLKDVPVEELSKGNSQSIAKYLAEKGLRYDLTLPLARYAVQHQDELAFPFKRFHIGPVWRADRPQKGRYQEFYQCDADIIGSTSLLNEVELTRIYSEILDKLGLKVVIKINSRKILEALFFLFKQTQEVDEEQFSTFVTILDKLDKIGNDGVKKELISKGYKESQVIECQKFLSELNSSGSSIEKLNYLEKNTINFLHSNKRARTGFEDIRHIFNLIKSKDNVEFIPTLARGLNYYTGTIWEVAMEGVSIGSLGGGGRYDNLTEMFGGQNMSGVGISFGIERIYDVMEELNLFPETISQGVKVLFVPRDASAEEFAFQQTQTVRDAGIPAEIFLGNVKKQKQFNYVEQKNIAFIVEVGGDEMSSKKFRLRNTKIREMENDLSIEQIIAKLQ